MEVISRRYHSRQKPKSKMPTIHYMKRWFFEMHNMPIPGTKEETTGAAAGITREPSKQQLNATPANQIHLSAPAQPAQIQG